MTALSAAKTPAGDTAFNEDSEKGGKAPGDDVGAFLAVFAALLLDTVLRFEESSGRVTDLVVASGRRDSELLVALQEFDRLQQEFESLGDALMRYAGSTSAYPPAGDERVRLGQDVVAAITVADLKNRLLSRLQDDALEPVESDAGLDVIF